MSFQAYLDTIKTKTGLDPEDFRQLATKKGLMKLDMKAGELVAWVKEEYGLGHGHAMALWNVFVSEGWVDTKHTKLTKRD